MPNISRISDHGLSGFAALRASLAQGTSAAVAQRAQRAEISTALRELGPVVYAVLTQDGLIKFGHSTNLPVRLAAYGIGVKNARRLLMVKPGSLVDEQIIHGRFARHVARGREYFHPMPEIIDFINEVRDQLGAPPLPL